MHVYGKLLPTNHDIFCKYLNFIMSGQDFQKICTDLQAATPCKENCEPEFVHLLVSRGGVIMNRTLTTAYLDKRCNMVRHSNCTVTDACVGGHTQITSSTMADALTFYDQDETTENRVFI